MDTRSYCSITFNGPHNHDCGKTPANVWLIIKAQHTIDEKRIFELIQTQTSMVLNLSTKIWRTTLVNSNVMSRCSSNNHFSKFIGQRWTPFSIAKHSTVPTTITVERHLPMSAMILPLFFYLTL